MSALWKELLLRYHGMDYVTNTFLLIGRIGLDYACFCEPFRAFLLDLPVWALRLQNNTVMMIQLTHR